MKDFENVERTQQSFRLAQQIFGLTKVDEQEHFADPTRLPFPWKQKLHPEAQTVGRLIFA